MYLLITVFYLIIFAGCKLFHRNTQEEIWLERNRRRKGLRGDDENTDKRTMEWEEYRRQCTLKALEKNREAQREKERRLAALGQLQSRE